ncbi:MAG: TIGR04282 family arsenosugar biosynthesis glycosyltransferase [Rhodospirillales bacterium]
MSRIALGIMCKAPVEGECKTRLCPPLLPHEAAALSRSFIADVARVVAEVASRTSATGIAIHTPVPERALEGLLPEGFATLEQRGTNLGERLLNVSRDLFGAGFTGICLINADSPTIPASLLEMAVTHLRKPGDRFVIGPAIDGGYYLIGLKHPHAQVFEGVSWGGSRVLAETLGRMAGIPIPVTLLPLWYDVDELCTLQLLIHELFGRGVPLHGGALAASPAPRTRSVIRALLQAEDAVRFGITLDLSEK